MTLEKITFSDFDTSRFQSALAFEILKGMTDSEKNELVAQWLRSNILELENFICQKGK